MSARKLAYTALLRMAKEKRYSNLALDALLKSEPKDTRESLQAAALFYGVLTRFCIRTAFQNLRQSTKA